MKVYTKTGDKGKTGLIGGKRVGKEDIRLEAYGTADEINALLGMSIAQCREAGVQSPLKTLESIQNTLFIIGSILATPDDKKEKFPLVLASRSTALLEQEIDQMDQLLPELKNFILPGGSSPAAIIHIARTVCRRLERRIATLYSEVKSETEILKYVNRLSDYLFTLARYINFKLEVPETIWRESAGKKNDESKNDK